jgi:cobalt-zinc-cadmium efflux system protein
VGVIAAALVILLTYWLYADPIISVLIGFLVLESPCKLLRDSTNILLEQAPRGIDANEVGRKMVGVEGVEDVHDLHAPGRVLYREFSIEHTTLQVHHVGDHAAEDERIKFLPQIRRRDAR